MKNIALLSAFIAGALISGLVCLSTADQRIRDIRAEWRMSEDRESHLRQRIIEAQFKLDFARMVLIREPNIRKWNLEKLSSHYEHEGFVMVPTGPGSSVIFAKDIWAEKVKELQ